MKPPLHKLSLRVVISFPLCFFTAQTSFLRLRISQFKMRTYVPLHVSIPSYSADRGTAFPRTTKASPSGLVWENCFWTSASHSSPSPSLSRQMAVLFYLIFPVFPNMLPPVQPPSFTFFASVSALPTSGYLLHFYASSATKTISVGSVPLDLLRFRFHCLRSLS